MIRPNLITWYSDLICVWVSERGRGPYQLGVNHGFGIWGRLTKLRIRWSYPAGCRMAHASQDCRLNITTLNPCANTCPKSCPSVSTGVLHLPFEVLVFVHVHHTILHDDILTGGYEFSLTLVLSPSTADFRFLSVLQAEKTSIVTPKAIIANAINQGGEMTSSYSPLQ